MAMDLATLRKLVALDENDPLSRFALGRKLHEMGTADALREAAGHLRFANERAPEHLATYHILAQVLMALGESGDARRVLEEGIERRRGRGNGAGPGAGDAADARRAERGQRRTIIHFMTLTAAGGYGGCNGLPLVSEVIR